MGDRCTAPAADDSRGGCLCLYHIAWRVWRDAPAQFPQLPHHARLIFRYLGRPGIEDYGQALAMSTLLMLVTAISFALIERLRLGNASEF